MTNYQSMDPWSDDEPQAIFPAHDLFTRPVLSHYISILKAQMANINDTTTRESLARRVDHAVAALARLNAWRDAWVEEQQKELHGGQSKRQTIKGVGQSKKVKQSQLVDGQTVIPGVDVVADAPANEPMERGPAPAVIDDASLQSE